MKNVRKQVIFIFFLSVLCSCGAEFFGPPPPSPPAASDRTPPDNLDIAGGRAHTCMLFEGRVRCWGEEAQNGYGVALGRMRTPGSLSKDLTFLRDPSMDPDAETNPSLFALQVVTGLSHTCVLLDDNEDNDQGPVRCWGGDYMTGTTTMAMSNANGELGRGDTMELRLASEAADIMFMPDVEIQQISAGSNHTCALSAADAAPPNTIFCWGSGTNGKLGNMALTNIGDTSPMIPAINAAVSGAFPMMHTPVKIAAGAEHTCVYFEDDMDEERNQIHCWGDEGALGSNGSATPLIGETLDPSMPPVPMESSLFELEIEDMVAGAGSTCIRTASGRAVCWGAAAGGQLGYGCDQDVHQVGSTATANATNPEQDDAFLVAGAGEPITEPVAGGMTEMNCRSGPDVISYQNYTDVTQVALGPGGLYSCVLRENGNVHCFGVNLGVRDSTASGFMIDTTMIPDVDCQQANLIGGSPLGYDEPIVTSFFPMIMSDNIISTRSTPVPIGGSAMRIGLGEGHACALLEGGSIKCWGINCEGQLGYGPSLTEDATGGGLATASVIPLNSYGTFPRPFP